jgi:hypothetical protein
MQFGSADFDPKWTRFAPKSPKMFPILFLYIMCYYILFISTGISLKGRCWGGNCLKKPKNGKKRQNLQSYQQAQFVQYGSLRVKYHTAYYTNSPYDPSQIFIYTSTSTLSGNISANAWTCTDIHVYTHISTYAHTNTHTYTHAHTRRTHTHIRMITQVQWDPQLQTQGQLTITPMD